MLKRVLFVSVGMIVVLGIAPAQVMPMGLSGLCESGPVFLSARAGWLDHPTGITLTTRFINDSEEYVDENPLKGAWLEFIARGSLSDRVGVLISGGMLAPWSIRGTEQETVGGTESSYSLSGTSWGCIQGLMTYGLAENFQVIGGFRWDHFNTRMDFSNSPAFLDFKLNSYVPLIGIQLDQQFYGGELITRIMGWPGTIPGHITQSYVGGPLIQAWTHIEQDLARGYMIEFLSEYRKTLYGSFSAGLFVRWDCLHVTTNEDTYDWSTMGGSGTGPVTEAFDRRSLTFGGSLVFDFALLSFL